MTNITKEYRKYKTGLTCLDCGESFTKKPQGEYFKFICNECEKNTQGGQEWIKKVEASARKAIEEYESLMNFRYKHQD